jgi:hypothetical protein
MKSRKHGDEKAYSQRDDDLVGLGGLEIGRNRC